MDTTEFLRQVWPAEGLFCIATPYPTGKGFRHEVFDNIDEAAAYALKMRNEADVYFSMHTLKAAAVYNEVKQKQQVRIHANMKGCRVLFCEIDIGEDPKKYSTQAEALAALKEFCKTTKLPLPTVTSSGRGLHVYWPLTDLIETQAWKVEAFRLHQLCQVHDLKVDPSKVTDQSAVLRVVGTFHRKDPTNPKPVRALKAGKVTPNAEMLKLLSDATIRAGLVPHMMPTASVLPPKTAKVAPVSSAEDVMVLDDEVQIFDAKLNLPPVDPSIRVAKTAEPCSMGALLDACGVVRYINERKGYVSEPYWYYGVMGVVQFVTDGHEWVHRISEGYPGYTREETDGKLAQWDKGVASCATIARHCGDDICKSCPHFKAGRHPIVAARKFDIAPTPIERYLLGTQVIEFPLIDPPSPYKRLAGNKIGIETVNKEGEVETRILLDYDIYPVRRQRAREGNHEEQVWKAVLPLGEHIEFVIPANDLYEQRACIGALAHAGVYPDIKAQEEVRQFMVAYIRKLQGEMAAEVQSAHLGWDPGTDQFILPDRLLPQSGNAKRAVLSNKAQAASDAIKPHGTVEGQKELLKFYSHEAYCANQFFILCSLGSPLMRFTEQNGVIVNATGQSGASKSTTLYAAASLWGHPTQYTMNGTNGGATSLARQERAQVLSNLPLCLDEITHIEMKQAQNMSMGVSQPGNRIRLDRNGNEKPVPKNIKASMWLTTANNSLHGLLATNNAAGTAGSMRIFEINFKLTGVHDKSEADDFLRALKENYGHIGPIMAAYYTQHFEEVRQRVIEVQRELDKETNMRGSERFWSAAASCALVAGEIAYKLNLLDYSIPVLRQWLLRTQLPNMRGVVNDEYVPPLGMLQNFLNEHRAGLVITDNGNLKQSPQGPLVGHVDVATGVYAFTRQAFNNFCIRYGSNMSNVLGSLFEDRVVTSINRKVTLGKNTPHAIGQTACFVVNGKHPAMAIELAEGPADESASPKVRFLKSAEAR